MKIPIHTDLMSAGSEFYVLGAEVLLIRWNFEALRHSQHKIHVAAGEFGRVVCADFVADRSNLVQIDGDNVNDAIAGSGGPDLQPNSKMMAIEITSAFNSSCPLMRESYLHSVPSVCPGRVDQTTAVVPSAGGSDGSPALGIARRNAEAR